mmetsp:Transcript_28887/g.54169  ORF Transcript_28887/g.54169 Transcript_28887/m.54169 type:complete len:343 (+) Transcript_28887:96-1124(+)
MSSASNAKVQLNEFLMKHCKRPVSKEDTVWTVRRFGAAEFQASVRMVCLDGLEYAGEVCADPKAAQNSAAEQVLVNNQELVDAAGSSNGKRKAAPVLNAAEKRQKALEEGALDPDNPAITPKTQLNSLVMKIVKRFLKKGETAYECKKVGTAYQATVTIAALPGEWGEHAWAGHLCATKQKAEQSAAHEALKDIEGDPEMAAEAATPKGGGRGKGKGKGKFQPMSGGWDMSFFDNMMLGAYGWSPMKGKGKGQIAPSKGSRPGRDRVTEEPCVGTVVEWHGQHGFLESALPIDHPLASARGGKIFIHQQDLPEGVESLLEGQPLSFHVYTDANGLGAEDVVM